MARNACWRKRKDKRKIQKIQSVKPGQKKATDQAVQSLAKTGPNATTEDIAEIKEDEVIEIKGPETTSYIPVSL